MRSSMSRINKLKLTHYLSLKYIDKSGQGALHKHTSFLTEIKNKNNREYSGQHGKIGQKFCR